jgi:hypothetical protein
VAVARKLAVLLHCLWVSGEEYEPLHNVISAPIAAAAGQGKGETRRKREDLVLQGRTGVEEARTSVDPEGLADNDIHRLVRVTAF